jgi:hypothetical protein
MEGSYKKQKSRHRIFTDGGNQKEHEENLNYLKLSRRAAEQSPLREGRYIEVQPQCH